jgi:hypothetical protein
LHIQKTSPILKPVEGKGKNDMEQILQTGEASQRLNMSTQHLRLLAKTGKVPALKTTQGSFLFKLSDILELKEYRETHPAPKGRQPRKGRAA